MNILPDGTMQFVDQYELTYELFNDLDLEVRPDGTVYDTRGCTILAFNGMNLKANINPYNIHYAGEGEIIFEPLSNVRLVTTLFGWDLERKIKEGQITFRTFSPSEMLCDDEIKRTNLTVKFDDNNSICTKYYHNKCLKFLEMIFILNSEQVDLSNFDIIEELPAKK